MTAMLPQFVDQPERTARIATLISVQDAEACQRLHDAIFKKLQTNTKTTAVEDLHVLCRVIAGIIATATDPEIRANLAADLPIMLNVIIEEELPDRRQRLAS